MRQVNKMKLQAKQEKVIRDALNHSMVMARPLNDACRVWLKKFDEIQKKLESGGLPEWDGYSVCDKGQNFTLQISTLDEDLWRIDIARRLVGNPYDEKTIERALAKLARMSSNNTLVEMVANGIAMFLEPAKSAMVRVYQEFGVGNQHKLECTPVVEKLWKFAEEHGLVRVQMKSRNADGLWSVNEPKRKRSLDELEGPPNAEFLEADDLQA
jgi:hypothetical protein